MPEDVMEWGRATEPAVRQPGRPWSERIALPPVTPYILAAIGAVGYFVSVSQPWRAFHYQPDSNTQLISATNDRQEYALTLGLGLAYTLGVLVLAALVPTALMGSQRMKRIATGVGVTVGVLGLAQLIAVITIGGKDSVYYETATELHQTVTVENGLYAAFAAVVAFALAAISANYTGARRRRAFLAQEPEFDTDTVRDLTVSAN
jgi:hypothetical protein